jgi:hypothetical protein
LLREYKCFWAELLALLQICFALEVFITKINMFALWAEPAARLAVSSGQGEIM